MRRTARAQTFTCAAFEATVLVVTLAAVPTLARAEDFYKGKTVNVIVGFSPGGGYDAHALALAQFLPAHIPGHPTIVVQNMPGAGSLVAVRSLDTTQPKDGTALVTFNNGLVNRAIVQPKVVKVDFAKLAWIGIVTPVFRVCYGYGTKGPKSWDGMMHSKQFILDTAAKGAGAYINGATMRVVFGAPRRCWAFRAARKSVSRWSGERSTVIAAPTAAFSRIGCGRAWSTPSSASPRKGRRRSRRARSTSTTSPRLRHRGICSIFSTPRTRSAGPS